MLPSPRRATPCPSGSRRRCPRWSRPSCLLLRAFLQRRDEPRRLLGQRQIDGSSFDARGQVGQIHLLSPGLERLSHAVPPPRKCSEHTTARRARKLTPKGSSVVSRIE